MRRVRGPHTSPDLGSLSVLLALGEEKTAAFLTEERKPTETFPDGPVEEVYDIDVIVATRS